MWEVGGLRAPKYGGLLMPRQRCPQAPRASRELAESHKEGTSHTPMAFP